MTGRKDLYEALAKKIPLMSRIVTGQTTFTGCLDGIVAGLETPDDFPFREFRDFYTSLSHLGQLPLERKELQTVIDYCTANSAEKQKAYKRGKILNASIYGAVAGGGLYLYLKRDPRFKTIALILEAAGGGGVAGTGATVGVDNLKRKWSCRKVRKNLTKLWPIANSLDAEVKKLFTE